VLIFFLITLNFFIMQKFLSIPKRGETAQLVALDGIVLIDQASTSTVTITYGGAAAQDVVTITFGAAMPANDVSLRDKIQDSVIAALQTSWLQPKYDVSLVGLEDALGAAVEVITIVVA
jgi:hypothetical protein